MNHDTRHRGMASTKVCVNRGCNLPVKKGFRFCGGLGVCLTPKSHRYEDAPLTADELKKVKAAKADE